MSLVLKELPDSAGICDNCKHPKLVNIGGDGINEPDCLVYYCFMKEIIIEPFPPEEQIKECEYYVKSAISKDES